MDSGIVHGLFWNTVFKTNLMPVSWIYINWQVLIYTFYRCQYVHSRIHPFFDIMDFFNDCRKLYIGCKFLVSGFVCTNILQWVLMNSTNSMVMNFGPFKWKWCLFLKWIHHHNRFHALYNWPLLRVIKLYRETWRSLRTLVVIVDVYTNKYYVDLFNWQFCADGW